MTDLKTETVIEHDSFEVVHVTGNNGDRVMLDKGVTHHENCFKGAIVLLVGGVTETHWERGGGAVIIPHTVRGELFQMYTKWGEVRITAERDASEILYMFPNVEKHPDLKLCVESPVKVEPGNGFMGRNSEEMSYVLVIGKSILVDGKNINSGEFNVLRDNEFKELRALEPDSFIVVPFSVTNDDTKFLNSITKHQKHPELL